MNEHEARGAEELSAPLFLTVGKVVAPHGVKGEVKVEVMTDFPERFAVGHNLYLDQHPRRVERSRPLKQLLVVKLAGVDTREEAEKLRNAELEIPIDEAMPLPEGEYYEYQIIGLEVWSSQGNLLGRIVDIFPTGSNDVYVVRSDNREFLVPAIEDVVLSIDLEKRRIVIDPLEGLLES